MVLPEPLFSRFNETTAAPPFMTPGFYFLSLDGKSIKKSNRESPFTEAHQDQPGLASP